MCACPARVVFKDRFAEAWRFTQTHRSRDDRFVNAFPEMLSHFRDDFGTQFLCDGRTSSSKCADFQVIVLRPSHGLAGPRARSLPTFEREIFALNWSENFIGGSERVRHQKPNEAGNRAE